MEPATILVTRPQKNGDPTEHTYLWGDHIVQMMYDYGYNVVDIKKDDVTYNNVSTAIKYYKPRLYVHIGHGCPTSLQGQTDCIITRKFSLDELLQMGNFREILMPLTYATGCKYTCNSTPEVCSPLCSNNTNVGLLKDCIVYTIACYSASQLGKCAIKYGTECYVGFRELMLFAVDDVHSQDIFRNVHLVFLQELLEGKSVSEAEAVTNRYEDTLIKFHKKTKYLSLPLIWNKINRRVLGNSNARIYE